MSLVDAIRQGRRPLAALRLKREHEASDRGTADREPPRQEEERAASGRGAGPSGQPCAAAAASSFYAHGERLRRVEHCVLRFLAAVQARLAGAAAAPGLYASVPTQAPAPNKVNRSSSSCWIGFCAGRQIRREAGSRVE